MRRLVDKNNKQIRARQPSAKLAPPPMRAPTPVRAMVQAPGVLSSL